MCPIAVSDVGRTASGSLSSSPPPRVTHASSGANHGSLAFMAAIDDLAGLAAVEALSKTSDSPA